jgi:heme/copper-type cytochrome/quinol oxidase subunit 2
MHSSVPDVIFWAAVALCAVAQLALLHSFFLGASRPAREAAATFRMTETLWAVVPALVLTLLLTLTWRAMHAPPTMEWRPGPAAPAGAPR